MKLGLGTAQFGFNYGVSNLLGKTPRQEVEKILALAQETGVKVVDTAPFYGESEMLLGQFLPALHHFHIVTKVRKIGKRKIAAQDIEQRREEFLASLNRLCQSSVYGLLVHHSEDLLVDDGHRLFEFMTELQSEGRIKKIGASCYSRDEIDRVIATYPIQLLQIPLNILDQRLIEDGYLGQLKSKGVEIHARSVFLQGLLLMKPQQLPAYFDCVRDHLRKFHDDISLASLSSLQACLSFVLSRKEIDAVICGVNSSTHFNELVFCAQTKEQIDFDFSRYALQREEVLNPTQWPAGQSS